VSEPEFAPARLLQRRTWAKPRVPANCQATPAPISGKPRSGAPLFRFFDPNQSKLLCRCPSRFRQKSKNHACGPKVDASLVHNIGEDFMAIVVKTFGIK
jgi:hypothetical protein